MLSKVLSGRRTEVAAPAVFPSATVSGERSAGAALAQNNPRSDSGQAALLEKIRRLESSRAAEVREAFDSGRSQGEEAARAEVQPVLERLCASIGEIAALRPELRRRAERDVIQLALLIARRILHRELAVDENALTALARVAFERLARSESCKVTVNPRFAPALAAALPASQASRIRIEPDPACSPGTLRFHSTDGLIDASVDAQLEEIDRGLTDRLTKS